MDRASAAVAALAYGTLFAIVLGVAGVLASRYCRGLIDDGPSAVLIGLSSGVAVGGLLGARFGLARARRRKAATPDGGPEGPSGADVGRD